MRATVLQGKKKGAGENVPDPSILNTRDAIIRVSSTAICGSDLHLYQGLVPTMERGDILGHEFMGEVVEVGGGVERLRVGDRGVVNKFLFVQGDINRGHVIGGQNPNR